MILPFCLSRMECCAAFQPCCLCLNPTCCNRPRECLCMVRAPFEGKELWISL